MNLLWQRIDDEVAATEVAATFERVAFTGDGLDLERHKLKGCASTWTYMINDTPTGNVLDRLTQGFKRRLTGK